MRCRVILFPSRNSERGVGVLKVPAHVRSLAAGLMWALQIKDGLELVHLIGNGDEYSNQRAIETWLMTHYLDEQLKGISEPLKSLSKALKRHIENHYNNLEVYSC